MEYKKNDYEELAFLGTGSFGCCSKIKRRRDGKVTDDVGD